MAARLLALAGLFLAPAALASSTPTLVPLAEAASLLLDDYQTLEAGYGLAADGLDVVAASTYMRGVTAPMIEWWFTWLSTTDQYKMWHPRDHVYAEWVRPAAGGYIGGSHLVKEYIGGELQNLNISFVSPRERFGADYAAKMKASNHSAAITARVSFYDFDSKLSTPVGHALHLVHDEPDGVRMRSRFWLGDLGPDTPKLPAGQSLVPVELTRGLQKHCAEEMAILATILPKLWRENSEEGKAGKPTGFDKSDPKGRTYPGPFGV
jgi:hypothetical protein